MGTSRSTMKSRALSARRATITPPRAGQRGAIRQRCPPTTTPTASISPNDCAASQKPPRHESEGPGENSLRGAKNRARRSHRATGRKIIATLAKSYYEQKAKRALAAVHPDYPHDRSDAAVEAAKLWCPQSLSRAARLPAARRPQQRESVPVLSRCSRRSGHEIENIRAALVP